MNVWLFGYGSLMWRPDFPFLERRRARVHGWRRRFWQGSHDHRGVPDAPGRVVTLVEGDGWCDGVAFLVDAEVAAATFDRLDHREKNGYTRMQVAIELDDASTVGGVVYVAAGDNHAFLGPAPLAAIAAQIRTARGPSGTNAEYLFDLATALRALDATDVHVFDLEAAVREETG